MMTRLLITELTIKRLYAKSGNQCSFPGCTEEFFRNDNSQNISEICHIEAANEQGQRYNPKSTDEERRSYSNLILLCHTHHAYTNDVEIYTVDGLKKMKDEHEQKVTQHMTEKKPELLALAISKLASIDFYSEQQNERFVPFSIENKIEHNDVKEWRGRIDSYKRYQGKIDLVYSELEKSGNGFRKDKLLRLIETIYTETKDKSSRASADQILDVIEGKLLSRLEEKETSRDDMTIAMPIIMVDAFMRCKILEIPPAK